MQGLKKERWMELAEKIAKEQDPEQFHKLVAELNTLLDEKSNRLDRQSQIVKDESEDR